MAAHTGALVRDETGVAYIEFIIAFVPLFILFLGVVQLALLATAQLVVRHSAVVAARAAVVVLPDDPKHYGDDEVGLVRTKASGGDSWSGALQGTASKAPTAGRMEAIRAAAHMPLAAITPHLLGFAARRSVEAAVGNAHLGRLMMVATGHLGTVTSVTFPQTPGSKDLIKDKVLGSSVTVRVTHLFACDVPVASRILCGSLTPGPTGKLLWSRDAQRAAFEELDANAPDRGFVSELAALTRPFAVLQAEATMSNQLAGYKYEK